MHARQPARCNGELRRRPARPAAAHALLLLSPAPAPCRADPEFSVYYGTAARAYHAAAAPHPRPRRPAPAAVLHPPCVAPRPHPPPPPHAAPAPAPTAAPPAPPAAARRRHPPQPRARARRRPRRPCAPHTRPPCLRPPPAHAPGRRASQTPAAAPRPPLHDTALRPRLLPPHAAPVPAPTAAPRPRPPRRRGPAPTPAAAPRPQRCDAAPRRLRLPRGEERKKKGMEEGREEKKGKERKKAAFEGFLANPNLSRRTFTVSEQQLQRLKQRIAERSPPPSAAPSSFVAVVALAWVSFVRAKHPDVVAPGDEVTLFFFADCRARLDPPPGDGYFGTCISGCLARATARDLLAEDDDDAVARAAAAVAEEVRRTAEEPLALWDWMGLVVRVELDKLLNVSGSTRFPAYEATDFGWGQPARTELVSMNHDGQVVLVAGKGGAGGVQVSVSLNPAHMDTFKSFFFSFIA
ncbi:hypothetical protein EJB05_09450, partial [Eragrostis curvula]